MGRALPGEEELLYSENKLDGYLFVTVNNGREESNVDVEILYKAVLARQRTIEKLFMKGRSR